MWQDYVNKAIEEFTSKKGLDGQNIQLVINTSRDGKKITSYSICFFEMNSISGNIEEGFSRTSNILNIVQKNYKTKDDCLEITVQDKMLDNGGEDVGSENGKIQFSLDDPAIGDFVTKSIEYSFSKYSSKESTFACCHRFKECSAETKCIHPNILYATGCQYKKNVEKGNCFLIND